MKDIVILGNADNIVELSDYRTDEVALGKLPYNALWMEGDTRCFNSETQQWFERSEGNYFPPHGLAATFNVLNKFLRDARANDDVISTTPYYAYPVTIPDIVTEELTGVFVVKKINKDSPALFAVGRLANNGEDTTKKLLRVGVNASGMFTWWDTLSSSSYIQYTNQALLDKLNSGEPIIFTVTSSKGFGSKMYLNGQLVGTTTRELALTENTLYLDRNANCHRGHTLLFKTDLSKNAKQLNLLHSTLKAYYNIQ